MPDKINIQSQRIQSLDVLRGFAMILIILFHSSVYNFANIHKIDFSNPPIIVVLMSFMALWGGVFIIYSMTVNTLMVLERIHKTTLTRLFLYPVLAGFIYIFLHYILNIFLGRWNNDFVYNRPDLTVVAGTLRNLHFTLPHISKFFEGSSLSTIAFNLIILSLVLFLILRNDGIKKENRNYMILFISATLIMAFSFVRVLLYHLLTVSIESKNYFSASILSFMLANPYPLLPYLAYGLFGIVVGMMIFFKRKSLLKKTIIPAGILFMIFGFSGMMNCEKTISKPDYFWYFKTNFELGIFLLILVITFLTLKSGSEFSNRMKVIRWFSRISLTIYMFETFTSEILRILYLSVYPSWNQTINGCLIFGGMNIILWIIILFFWSKIKFRYSLEYFWVKFFSSRGKNSTKMDFLP